MKNSNPASTMVAVIFVGAIMGGLDLIISYWQYGQYASQEQDYVCYNDMCNFVPLTAYSVNEQGTCLTEDMFGVQTQDCGGKIEITKYSPISFWQWLNYGSTSTPPTTRQ